MLNAVESNGFRAPASGADTGTRDEAVRELDELSQIAAALAKICSGSSTVDCPGSRCLPSRRDACREHLLQACSLFRGLLLGEFVREQALLDGDLPRRPWTLQHAARRSPQAGFSTRFNHLVLNFDPDCIARGRDALEALVAEWVGSRRR